MTKIKDKRIIAKAKRLIQLKEKMEKPFISELKSYFAKVKAAAAKGQTFPSIESVIRFHNSRIVKTMTTRKSKKIDTAKLAKVLTVKNESMVKSHFKSINRTTLTRWQSAQESARAAHKEGQDEKKAQDPGQTALNKTAIMIFDQVNQRRVPIISNAESVSIVNTTKHNLYDETVDDYIDALKEDDLDEAQDIADLNDSIAMEDGIEDYENDEPLTGIVTFVSEATKTWCCMFENSCEICEALDGQTVSFDDPFVLDGEDYFEPVDDTHPNCNCCVIF